MNTFFADLESVEMAVSGLAAGPRPASREGTAIGLLDSQCECFPAVVYAV
jgi:hypothetical protein